VVINEWIHGASSLTKANTTGGGQLSQVPLAGPGALGGGMGWRMVSAWGDSRSAGMTLLGEERPLVGRPAASQVVDLRRVLAEVARARPGVWAP
jgi:hypothetical protein